MELEYTEDTMRKLNILSDRGDADAQYCLGEKYYNDGEVREAIRYFMLADRNGSPHAANYLGCLLMDR
ncbi:MAG: hypothetical protein IK093_11815, partial [Ruminiclostridium sp.]|nr:hypothetical protein [Ruminiclostridium sp.]